MRATQGPEIPSAAPTAASASVPRSEIESASEKIGARSGRNGAISRRKRSFSTAPTESFSRFATAGSGSSPNQRSFAAAHRRRWLCILRPTGTAGSALAANRALSGSCQARHFDRRFKGALPWTACSTDLRWPARGASVLLGPDRRSGAARRDTRLARARPRAPSRVDRGAAIPWAASEGPGSRSRTTESGGRGGGGRQSDSRRSKLRVPRRRFRARAEFWHREDASHRPRPAGVATVEALGDDDPPRRQAAPTVQEIGPFAPRSTPGAPATEGGLNAAHDYRRAELSRARPDPLGGLERSSDRAGASTSGLGCSVSRPRSLIPKSGWKPCEGNP